MQAPVSIVWKEEEQHVEVSPSYEQNNDNWNQDSVAPEVVAKGRVIPVHACLEPNTTSLLSSWGVFNNQVSDVLMQVVGVERLQKVLHIEINN